MPTHLPDDGTSATERDRITLVTKDGHDLIDSQAGRLAGRLSGRLPVARGRVTDGPPSSKGRPRLLRDGADPRAEGLGQTVVSRAGDAR